MAAEWPQPQDKIARFVTHNLLTSASGFSNLFFVVLKEKVISSKIGQLSFHSDVVIASEEVNFSLMVHTIRC